MGQWGFFIDFLVWNIFFEFMCFFDVWDLKQNDGFKCPEEFLKISYVQSVREEQRKQTPSSNKLTGSHLKERRLA